MAVLMIAGGHHFFADVRELETQCWIRYDGLIADGIGQQVAPPVGAITRGGFTFYPNLVVYMREDAVRMKIKRFLLILSLASLFSPEQKLDSSMKLDSSIAGWADLSPSPLAMILACRS